MKRIALITTWFPPKTGVATNRMTAFAKYLGEEYKVDVFALDQDLHHKHWRENVNVYYSKSYAILEKLKDKQSDSKLLHYFKTGTRIIFSKFIKFPLKKWQDLTLKKLLFKHKELAYDFIISSYSPVEAHLVVLDFLKVNSKIPWIADMRDEMSTNPMISNQDKILLQKIESLVNEKATAITTVSDPILNDFKKICKNVQYFEEIRNGFDHDLKFEENVIIPETNTIKLGYFGSFSGEQKPDLFFECLIELLNEIKDFDFEFHLFAAYNNFNIPTVIKDRIFMHEGLPYLEAVKKMNSMDANLLLYPKTGRVGIFSGKLFDYLSVRKPIIALIEKSDVASKLIIDLNAGYVAEFSEKEEIKSELINLYTDWKQGTVKAANPSDISQLHRKVQVKKMIGLIKNNEF